MTILADDVTRLEMTYLVSVCETLNLILSTTNKPEQIKHYMVRLKSQLTLNERILNMMTIKCVY